MFLTCAATPLTLNQGTYSGFGSEECTNCSTGFASFTSESVKPVTYPLFRSSYSTTEATSACTVCAAGGKCTHNLVRDSLDPRRPGQLQAPIRLCLGPYHANLAKSGDISLQQPRRTALIVVRCNQFVALSCTPCTHDTIILHSMYS